MSLMIYSYKKQKINISFKEWNYIRSIFFDNYKGNKKSFLNDDIGYIKPNILTQLFNERKIKKKYYQLKDELNTLLIESFIFEECSDQHMIEYYEVTNYHRINELQQIIRVFDFLIQNQNVGIYY